MIDEAEGEEVVVLDLDMAMDEEVVGEQVLCQGIMQEQHEVREEAGVRPEVGEPEEEATQDQMTVAMAASRDPLTILMMPFIATVARSLSGEQSRRMEQTREETSSAVQSQETSHVASSNGLMLTQATMLPDQIQDTRDLPLLQLTMLGFKEVTTLR